MNEVNFLFDENFGGSNGRQNIIPRRIKLQLKNLFVINFICGITRVNFIRHVTNNVYNF